VVYTVPAGVKTVTINDLGSFTVDVDVTGLSDTDGSEKAIRLAVDGVQRGITVNGATMGISGANNIWFLDIQDTAILAAGAKYTLTFNVTHGIIPDADSTIKITAYSQDSGASSVVNAETQLRFVDAMIDGAGAPPPPDIIATMIKLNPVVTEDASFKLSEVLAVTADTVNDPGATGIYSIAFKAFGKVSFDITLSTYSINSYNDGVNDIYVITTTGGQANIDAILNSVYLKPTLNYNQNNAAGNNLVFDATLTAYQSTGYGRDTASVSFSSIDNALSVKPVTDAITASETITYVDEGGGAVASALEDGTYTIKINLSGSDAPYYTYVQGAADATAATTVTMTWTSGIFGTLVWGGGGSYTFDATHTFADIPVAHLNDGTLKFTPTLHKAGNVSFSYNIYAQETGADNISTTTKSFTINAVAVVDVCYCLPSAAREARTHIYRRMRIYLCLRLWTTL